MRRLHAAACCAWLLLAACSSSGPPSLDPTTVTWKTWSDSSVGYSLRYPDAWTAPSGSSSTYAPFRFGRFMPLIIRWVDAREVKRSGLWNPDAPSGRAEVGGVAGRRYVYTHWDGLFGARMISYVVPFKGRFLGVEFRTNTDLDAVAQVVLESFTLQP